MEQKINREIEFDRRNDLKYLAPARDSARDDASTRQAGCRLNGSAFHMFKLSRCVQILHINKLNARIFKYKYILALAV